MDCPHLIPDENGNCSECVAAIPNMEAPNLGDIVGICNCWMPQPPPLPFSYERTPPPKTPPAPACGWLGGRSSVSPTLLC